jgi:hypothetical protein
VSSLAKALFPLPDFRRTPISLLGWWEQRRPLYNLAVGSAGIITLLAVKAISWLPPGLGTFEIPWVVVVAYAVLANCCYSLGWLTEVALTKLWGEDTPPIGPPLFRQGLAFSVGLTLLPIIIVSMGWLFKTAQVIGGLVR